MLMSFEIPFPRVKFYPLNFKELFVCRTFEFVIICVREKFALRRLLNFLFYATIMVLAACGNINYNAVEAGRFEGSLFVMWVGAGNSTGDGRFVFAPNPRDPLVFIRHDVNGDLQKIMPEIMYTDGGSIPKVGQLFNGFSPWGYAPAYMIHDWLFVARHCNKDGVASSQEKKFKSMAFLESATIIAEAIKTLVESGRVSSNDVAASTISSAVAGPISKALWEKEGTCLESRVTEQHKISAEAAIPGSTQRILRSVGAVPARIVGEFAF